MIPTGFLGGSIPLKRGWNHGIRTAVEESLDASLHPGGEGAGRPAGAPAPQGARHRPGRCGRVASQLGYGVESVRAWVKQADIDEGVSPGTTQRRERADQGPRAGESRVEAGQRDPAPGLGFFRGGARPPTEVIVDFIDANRDELGVEPICRGLQVAPSTYYAAKKRPPSARARARRRDAADPAGAVEGQLLGLWGPQAVEGGAQGRPRHRPGPGGPAHAPGRHRGIKRGRRVITTRRDDEAPRSPDLVKRNFTAERPNALWVTDLTYVPTWSGVAYVCFIVDAFSRMIVGWRVAANMRTDMVLDALEMARWSRGTHLDGPGDAFRRRQPVGRVEYRASVAQWKADLVARRPKVAKLVANELLHDYVQDRLSGRVVTADGEILGPDGPTWSGRNKPHRRDRRWVNGSSTEQIANRLKVDFPHDESMRISHEAIYQALYVQGPWRAQA